MDLDVGCRVHERYTSVADDFTSPAGRATWTMSFRRKEWDVQVRTSTTLTCDAEEFHVNATLDAYEAADASPRAPGTSRSPGDAL